MVNPVKRNVLFDRVDLLCREIVKTLEGIEAFQRRFFPAEIVQLRQDLLPLKASLKEARQAFSSAPVQTGGKDLMQDIDDGAGLVLETLDVILTVPDHNFENVLIQVMRAFRKCCRAQEILFSKRNTSIHLNRFFFEESLRNRIEATAPPPAGQTDTGLHHFNLGDDPYARGSVSFYVPESYDGRYSWPLVVALHGGFGHGKDFIWTWVREARSRHFLLAAPTSMGATWSLLNPDVDMASLQTMLNQIKEKWRVDPDRILITGISDGGTFALISSLHADAPFTAFAPIACALPPMDFRPARGKRIYWTHGALDWMFPVNLAQSGFQMLKMAGGDVILQVIEDLSHTYPREANDRILKWFDPGLALQPAPIK